ncbi:MAG: hypothetical protein GWP48_15590 [Actinobacteria bacterium]|nr:hypothetical protein [Actinomycetota bacterium]
MNCPCGPLRALDECCGPVIAGDRRALTATDLMRSRYTAYATGNRFYLVHSWSPMTCPIGLALDASIRWCGLEIVDTERGGAFDAEGVVEFVARFVAVDGPGELRERSRFGRLDGRWVYLDGVVDGPA